MKIGVRIGVVAGCCSFSWNSTEIISTEIIAFSVIVTSFCVGDKLTAST